MPQPLHRVLPDAAFQATTRALVDKPELARWVTIIFANSALIDHYLSLLVVRILGTDEAPALAMFDTITAQRLRFRALEAAAEAALSKQEYRVLIAGWKVAERVRTPRNHFAHWIWGVCDQLPEDALLLADPKAQKNRDRELVALEKSETSILAAEQIERLMTYDPSTVLFYRIDDLERAATDTIEARSVTFSVCNYLDPNHRALRDHLFDSLCKQRLFHEAWDQTS
jgi:hypothetical protein